MTAFFSTSAPWIAAIALGCIFTTGVNAQTRFDPARASSATTPDIASQALMQRQADAVSAGLDEENDYAPASPGDTDLGAQLILKRQEKNYPFRAWLDTSGYWTDNAANVSEGEIDDWFFVGGVNLGWQQQLHGRIYGDVYAGQHIYRYDRLDELDYEDGEAAAGFLVLLPELANSIFHVHYYYQRITQDIDDSAIYQTHNIKVGIQKTFLINRLSSFNVNLTASLALDTEPDVLQRHEYSGQFGYSFKIMQDLVLGASYRLGYYDYFNLEGRQDWYQNFGIGITWQPYECLDITASYNYSINESNKDVFDYESQLAGPSLALKFKF